MNDKQQPIAKRDLGWLRWEHYRCWTIAGRPLCSPLYSVPRLPPRSSTSSNAPQLAAAADCIDKKPANEDSPSNPPRDGLNSNVRVSSVSVPSTRQIEVNGVRMRRVFKGWIDENSLTATVPGTGMAIAVSYVLFKHEMPLHFLFEGDCTAKCDVYSFGVVLLEMLTGRRAVDKYRPSEEQNLVEWARRYLASKRKVVRIFEGRLEGQYSAGVALGAANLASQCLSIEPRCRPNMDEVVQALEKLQG
ncbi:hypothetical protein ACFX2K_001277 [Malus domestica]